ncbi:MAG: (2Fe-2S) ferredoxin domain-containing protein [Candidatus Aminicenantes bacterium]|nr:(2Fe-2S) ferredoxin domain-containing protein [Candidatus Aminicenantes bacterium]
MPKLTIDELIKIREKAKGDRIISADGPYSAKVTVHMGTCGIAAGARKIMEALIEEIERKGVKDIYLTTSGCAGLCSHEPMITVELANSIPVKYIDLTEEKVVEIFNKHLIEHKPVMEYALAAGSERSI